MQHHLKDRTDLLSQDAKREFINKSRSQLEQLLRQTTRGIILTKYGRTDAKRALLLMFSKARQTHLEHCDLSDLLSTGSSKLYLTDFFGIIENLASDFEKLTDLSQSEIKRYISDINNTRFDAHSNLVSDTDFNKFRNSYVKLSDALRFAS